MGSVMQCNIYIYISRVIILQLFKNLRTPNFKLRWLNKSTLVSEHAVSGENILSPPTKKKASENKF